MLHPAPQSVEKLISTKLVPHAKKAGDLPYKKKRGITNKNMDSQAKPGHMGQTVLGALAKSILLHKFNSPSQARDTTHVE